MTRTQTLTEASQSWHGSGSKVGWLGAGFDAVIKLPPAGEVQVSVQSAGALALALAHGWNLR